ncbi:MAG TPA: hemerythrin domain-containing protein, partial [Burkholderiaceae bacterium]|nr:hemerythrin domain-containing protein [Burkholderiaceae bacterium]
FDSTPERARKTMTSERYNIYALIHKGLRAWMCDVLTAVGRMDPHDSAEVAATLGEVRALLAGCASHLEHENDYLHPALEARAPGSALATAREHAQHERSLARLEESVAGVERATGSARVAAAMELYRQLALFIAENFEHMHAEETQNHATLTAHYNEAEVFAIEQAIVGSLAPEETMTVMRWMAPAAAPQERAALLSGLQQNAPRPAFEAVLELVKPYLTGREWAKLGAVIGPMPLGGDESMAAAPAEERAAA